MKTKTTFKLILSLVFINLFIIAQSQVDHKTIDWKTISSGGDSETIIFDNRDPIKMVLTIKDLNIDSIKTILITNIICNESDIETINIPHDKFDNEIIAPQTDTTLIKLFALFEYYGDDNYGLKNSCTLSVKIIANDNKPYSFNIELKGKKSTKKETKTERNIDVNQLSIPIFNTTNNEYLQYSKRNRILLIDAHPNIKQKQNNLLLERNKKVDTGKLISEQFKEVKSLYINSSLGILIRNYNLDRTEQMVVTINGVDYSYEKDIRDLLDMSKVTPTDNDTPATFESTNDNKVKDDYFYKYLKRAYNSINKNEYLNINDLNQLNAYKIQLKEYTENYSDTLSPEAQYELGKILYWSPEFISLTPIALEVPENDEIEISLKIENAGKATKEYHLGSYKTKGGMGFNLGGLFYITGLANNDVYTESYVVDSTTTELRAYIDSTNKVSVGIGFNAEFNFRTGTLIRPTINVGFFVPLGTELTPNLAIGPGFSLGNKKVKFSLNGGLAFGQINSVAERYKDKDVSNVTDLTSLTKKVWKPSWYVGIGVSFNVGK